MIKFAKQLPAICLSGLVAGALVTTAATARSMANQETLSVVKVMSVPAGRGPLSRRHLNTVPVHPNLSFKVVIRNGATPQNVTVTLRITRAPSSIGSVVKTKAIALGANRTVPVTFRNLDVAHAGELYLPTGRGRVLTVTVLESDEAFGLPERCFFACLDSRCVKARGVPLGGF